MARETFPGFLDSRLVAFAPARFARNDRGEGHRYGPAKARALIRTLLTEDALSNELPEGLVVIGGPPIPLPQGFGVAERQSKSLKLSLR